MAQRPESRTPSRLLGEDAAIQRLRVWTPLSWRLTWGRKVELLARGNTAPATPHASALSRRFPISQHAESAQFHAPYNITLFDERLRSLENRRDTVGESTSRF